ncbi:hypothetical protein MRX96_018217 [Rhipicephalus microplus]
MPDAQVLGSSGQRVSYAPIAVPTDDIELAGASKDETTETDKLSPSVDAVDFSNTCRPPAVRSTGFLHRHRKKIIPPSDDAHSVLGGCSVRSSGATFSQLW